jgi:hypothetical protein
MISEQILNNIARGLGRLELEPLVLARVYTAVFAPLLADHRERPAPAVKKQAAAADQPKVSRRAKAKPERKHTGGSAPALSTVTAMEFLKQELASGPKLASDVDAAATKRDISLNSLGRAKTKLGIVPQRVNSGHGNTVQLALP